MNIENSVHLIGNLGDEPKVSYTQGGTALCKFSMATSSKRKDKEGNVREDVQWHRIVLFGRLAEIAGEYLRKGSKIAVAGMIRYGKYDKDGVTNYTTEIACDQMKMLDARPADADRSQRPAPQRQPQATQRQAPPMDDFSDDDIPF